MPDEDDYEEVDLDELEEVDEHMISSSRFGPRSRLPVVTGRADPDVDGCSMTRSWT